MGTSPVFVSGVMLFAVLVNFLGVNIKAIVPNYGWFSDCWIDEERMKFKACLRSWKHESLKMQFVCRCVEEEGMLDVCAEWKILSCKAVTVGRLGVVRKHL